MGVKTKPKAKIDSVELEKCAAAGFTIEETATYLGLDPSTIYRHKREKPELQEAIKRGKVKAHAEVSDKLFEQCKEGNVSAIIWYEKTRRGMSDKVSLDFSKLTDEQLAALLQGKD